jgi:hypothetical protein
MAKCENTIKDYNRGFHIGATLALAVHHTHAEAGVKTLGDLVTEYLPVIEKFNGIMVCGYDAGIATYICG